jgi:hypothetical protein
MKSFENKKTEFTDKEKEVGFAKMAIFVLNNPPKNGWDPMSIKKSLTIEAKMEKAKMGEKIKLEDAEFDYLYERAQPENMRWALKHQAIVDFSEYLDELKKK